MGTKQLNLLQILKEIIGVSNNAELSTNQKLHQILLIITKATETAKGSIMIKKDRLSMEVAASTNPDIIGIKQPLNTESPSCWVFRNKKPLYVSKNNKFNSKEQTNKYKKSSFFIIPIIRNDDVIGLINLTEKKNADCFSDEERSLLLDIAGVIISQIKTFRLAEKIEANKKDLEEKNRQLQKLEKIRSEFFQMMVHDLKGPVSEVIANLDILSYTVSEENMEYVKAAQTGCDNMYSMVSNLLDITRIEEGEIKLIKEKIYPNELLEDARSKVFATAKNENISIDISDQCTKDDAIWIDRGIMSRVFQNLILNAVHHGKPLDTITLGCVCKDSCLEFYVRDNGKGIPEDLLPSIFEKYFHRKSSYASTGLGLSSCKLAIESHKGKIWVESKENFGSTFYFSLPKIKSESDEKEFKIEN